MEVIGLIKKKKTERYNKNYIAMLCNVMGSLTFLFLMTYFLLMAAIGLRELYSLRDLNFLILTGGILLGLFMYKRKHHDKIDFLTGMKIGIRITLTAVFPFSLLIYSYLATDMTFINYFKARLNTGELIAVSGDFITPLTLACIICIEGVISGCIITMLAMQYLKRDHKQIKNNGHE
ncbi:MAG: hypothetical protein ACXVPN_11840 [Bacteroidia bacterium]